MTFITIFLSVIFIVAAFWLNVWIIVVYSAPVFREIQRVLTEKVKRYFKRGDEEDGHDW